MRPVCYIDMHCHPAIKPYSQTLCNNENDDNENGNNENARECRNVETSLWYNHPPGGSDRVLNRQLGLTRFTQSDFRTLTKGDVKIIGACLGPVEYALFMPRWSLRRLVLGVLRFSLEVSREYILRARHNVRNYFAELTEEYEYYLEEQAGMCNQTSPTQFEFIADQDDIPQPCYVTDTIHAFFSIEGCHVVNNGGLENEITDEAAVRANIQAVRAWDHPPLYVSMAHHIYNGLCGHARSLPSLLHILIRQRHGMGTGFTDMGRAVLHALLNQDNGRRIYIDIKHMSVQSRREYYDILDSDYEDERIPVLASHGAVNGLSMDGNGPIGPWNGDDYQSEVELNFNGEDINFFNEEIIMIERTGGFLGIQLDERRLSSTGQGRLRIEYRPRGEQLDHQAGLIWKQIRYIAEVLDDAERFGWGTATIGSDYDGAVDPPNGYWTSGDFGILEENLIRHAAYYFENYIDRLTHEENMLPDFQDAQEQAHHVIHLFMHGNAIQFLEEYL